MCMLEGTSRSLNKGYGRAMNQVINVNAASLAKSQYRKA